MKHPPSLNRRAGLRRLVTRLAAGLCALSSATAAQLAVYEFNNTLSSTVTPAGATPSSFTDGPGYNTANATGYSTARRYVLSQAIQSGVATTCLANGD